MTIYKNPTENVYYCENAQLIRWAIDGQIITFNWPNTIFGSKWYEQELPSEPTIIKRIVWDCNGGGSHTISNNDNYSYSIENDYDSYTGCQLWEVWATYSLERCINNVFTWTAPVTGKVGNFYNPKPTWVNLSNDTATCNSIKYTRNRYQIQINHKSSNCLNNLFSVFGLYSGRNSTASFNVIRVNDKIPKNLIINDGNQTYKYPLGKDVENCNVREEVNQVENNNDESFYYFTSTDVFLIDNDFNPLDEKHIQVLAKSGLKPTLSCGLDCIGDTCLKIRNGSNICCYDDNLKLLEVITDDNNEVNTCYTCGG